MSGFEDLLGGMFRDPVKEATESLRKASADAAAKSKQEKRDTAAIPVMHSKIVDGKKYLLAEDVVEALRVTDSAIRVRNHIQKWLARG